MSHSLNALFQNMLEHAFDKCLLKGLIHSMNGVDHQELGPTFENLPIIRFYSTLKKQGNVKGKGKQGVNSIFG